VTEHQPPRLDRIVIGTDFSEPARAAAEWAVRVLAPNAEVMLVHALDLEAPVSLGDRSPTVSDAVLRAAREFAEARLRDTANALARPTARVEVPAGRPPTAIAALAENWGADLIVVGPHGERAPGSNRLGTSAERLIRISPIPVLLATGANGRRPRRLLVPVDEVDLTAAVLDWARMLAQRDGAAVTLVHVLDPRPHALPSGRPVPGSDAAAAGHGPTTPEDVTSATEAWLGNLARELSGSVQVDLVVETGRAGEHVLAAARRSSADLIVMGRRGRGRVHPGVLGSTASVVLRETSCPVLVVVDPTDAILDDWAVDASAEA
jgi:nucleotide-binding universal stress UspA family protein